MDQPSPPAPPTESRFAQHWLTFGMLGALILGAGAGELLFGVLDTDSRAAWADNLRFFGDLVLIKPLKMLLVPLIVASVVVGTASLEPARLGKLGGLAVLFYLGTMLAAGTLGVVLVTTIQPGQGFDAGMMDGLAADGGGASETLTAASGTGLIGAFKNLLSQLVPGNPVADAAAGRILPLVSFSIFTGLVVSLVGAAAQPVRDLADAVLALVMRAVTIILWAAPVGVFLLTAYATTSVGLAELVGPLLGYILTVLAGLLIHALIVLPLILWLFGRANPWRYLWQVRGALVTAMATSSSSATLPVTIRETQRRGSVKRESAEFVLPLGATINMDGTALYEAVAVIFLFQCFGIDLTLSSLLIVAVTATLAAVGAAGIPSAGLVTMVIVIEAVNAALPPEVAALPLAAVGVLLGVDRILDMSRTTVNVWGDAVGAKLISRFITPAPAPMPAPDGEDIPVGATRLSPPA